ncbi:DNA polymerase, partial [Herbiconiux daphne]
GYCENDIVIITAYIDEQISQYGSICKIPATNTGRVREKMRDNCLMKSKGVPDRNQFNRYRGIMEQLTMTPEVYLQANQTFMGGFTHANANHAGKTLHNVSSVDFTSSYPSVMLSEKFPMSRFKPIEINTAAELEKACSQYAVMMDITFHNIVASIPQECYLSASKCRDGKKVTENNGRVALAEEITISITEIDFDIIRKCYRWDSMEVSNAMYAHKNYLPKPIIET